MRRFATSFGSVAALIILIGSARRARHNVVSPREEQVFRSFNDGPEWLYPPVWVVMQCGSLAAVGVATAALLRRHRGAVAVTSLAAGVPVWGGVKLVKPLVGRGRPGAELEDVAVRGQAQTGLGYPSGHAAVAVTLAVVATIDRPPGVRAALLAVAGVTGCARMYVGAHLPLDVVGGLAIGLLGGRLASGLLGRTTRSPG